MPATAHLPPIDTLEHRGELRYGITSNGRFLERWQFDCIRKLEEANATLALVVQVEPGLSQKDRARNLQGKSREKRVVIIDETLPKVEFCQQTSASGNARPETLGKIIESKLDFILHFADGPLQPEIQTIPRYGVWVFKHGDQNSEPKCFWEVYLDQPITQVVLEKMEHSANKPLWAGQFRTIRSSYTRNLDQVLSGVIDWPAKMCRRIRSGDIDSISSSALLEHSRAHDREPSRGQIVSLRLRTLIRRVESVLRTVFRYTTWNVGIVESPIQSFLSTDFQPKVRWLPESRKGHIQADPFGRERDGKVQVLFERLDYLHRRGNICTVDFNNGEQIPEPKIVIKEPVHMSYPYIFEYAGETYCIPETNQAREVSVYRAIQFPTQWEKTGQKLLSNIRAIDTTIFENDGRWWLAFTDRERGGDANLYLWYSDNIWGSWTPHPLNPVKTDVRSSRPGGTPFIHEGRLYRPAQDCSRTGGGQLIINRVDRLTLTDFSEVPVTTIPPFRNSVYKAGMHTLSAAGNCTLVDGKRFRFVPSGLLSNMAKAFTRWKDRPSRSS